MGSWLPTTVDIGPGEKYHPQKRKYLNMYLVLDIACIFGLARANVVPAYSGYKDALAYLDKIDTDDMIEILRELIDQRLMEEKADREAANYNQKYIDASPVVEGFPSGQPGLRKKRFFWNKERKEKANRRYGMWISAINKSGNKHDKAFYDGTDRWNIY